MFSTLLQGPGSPSKLGNCQFLFVHVCTCVYVSSSIAANQHNSHWDIIEFGLLHHIRRWWPSLFAAVIEFGLLHHIRRWWSKWPCLVHLSSPRPSFFLIMSSSLFLFVSFYLHYFPFCCRIWFQLVLPSLLRSISPSFASCRSNLIISNLFFFQFENMKLPPIISLCVFIYWFFSSRSVFRLLK